jgi:hypothetical protein
MQNFYRRFDPAPRLQPSPVPVITIAQHHEIPHVFFAKTSMKTAPHRNL